MAKRPKSYYGYTADNGTVYKVFLSDDIGNEGPLGFSAAAGTEPDLPRNMEMRRVILQPPDGSQSFERPVGSIGAAVWTAPLTTVVALDVFNDAADTSCIVTSRIGEREMYRLRPLPVGGV